MESKKCPSCNIPVGETAKFCPECGAPLGSVAASGSSAKKSSTQLRDLAIIFGVLVVVVGAFLIIRKPQFVPEPARQTEKEITQQPRSATMQQPAADPHQQSDAMPGLAALDDSLPKDYMGLVNAGNQYMDHQQFPIAAEAYKRALAINGSDINVRVDYGACLHGMGLADRAIEEFRKALASQPNHPIANFNMGIVFMDKQLKDSAVTYFHKYLTLDPNGQAALAAQKFLKDLGG